MLLNQSGLATGDWSTAADNYETTDAKTHKLVAYAICRR